MDDEKRRETGLKNRRAVLGDAHVDRSLANRTELTSEFQDLIIRYAWGDIWARPGLDHRTRRLLVLTTTAAMGRWEEFRLHARASLDAGLPLDAAIRGDVPLGLIKETLMQLAIYAGLPAANTAFHIVEELRDQRSAGKS